MVALDQCYLYVQNRAPRRQCSPGPRFHPYAGLKLCAIYARRVKIILQESERLLYMELRRLVNAMLGATTFGKGSFVQRIFGWQKCGRWERCFLHAAAPMVAPPRRRGLPRVVRFLAGEAFDISPPPSMNLMSSSMLRESLNLLPRVC